MLNRMVAIYDNSKVDNTGYPSANYIATLFEIDSMDTWEQPRKDNLIIYPYVEERYSRLQCVCLSWLPLHLGGVNNDVYFTTN